MKKLLNIVLLFFSLVILVIQILYFANIDFRDSGFVEFMLQGETSYSIILLSIGFLVYIRKALPSFTFWVFVSYCCLLVFNHIIAFTPLASLSVIKFIILLPSVILVLILFSSLRAITEGGFKSEGD